MWPSFPFCPSCLVFRGIRSWRHSLSPRPVRCVWPSPVLLLVFLRGVFLVSFSFRRFRPRLCQTWLYLASQRGAARSVGHCRCLSHPLCFLLLPAFFLSSLCSTPHIAGWIVYCGSCIVYRVSRIAYRVRTFHCSGLDAGQLRVETGRGWSRACAFDVRQEAASSFSLFRDWDRGGHRRFGGDNQRIAPPPRASRCRFVRFFDRRTGAPRRRLRAKKIRREYDGSFWRGQPAVLRGAA